MTDLELRVRSHDVSGRIDAPEDPKGGVVVLPGMNHGPFEDVFDRFADRAVAAGLAVCRLALWGSREDLAALSLAAITDAAAAGVDRLRERGAEPVDAVAKSFGGGALLTGVPASVGRVVLWAPAVRVGESGNVGRVRERRLGEVDEIRVGETRLGETPHPTRVFHGDADETVDPAVSRRIAAALPGGEFRSIPDTDHSFDGAADETVERTLAFLRS